MTDKEFKRLSRAQMIDIIYEFQLKQDELTAEYERLTNELADKRIRMSQVGNIAEASLEIHNVMQAAQAAAEQYLEEIRTIRAETEKKCQQLINKAQQEAEAIIARAREGRTSYDPKLEVILKEFNTQSQTTGEHK